MAKKKQVPVSGLKTPEKFTFRYLYTEDYHPEYVSGAFGGLSPSKDIVINFYFERQGLPKYQYFAIEEDGRIGKERLEERVPDYNKSGLVRQVKSGVILNLQTAIEIRAFLDRQIEQLEKMFKGEEGTDV